jgi:hypothetical protein
MSGTKDYINVPEDGPGYSCDASIDRDRWLADVADVDITGELPEDFDGWDNDPAVLETVASVAAREGSSEDYALVSRDNVYNSENDFDSVFTFSVYAPNGSPDWVWADGVFVAVTLHLGGDPRGSYGATKLYRIDSPADAGFLDWTIGWSVDTDTIPDDCEIKFDEFAVGYSSNPTHHMSEAFETELGLWKGGAFYHETGRDENDEPTYSPIAMYPSPF